MEIKSKTPIVWNIDQHKFVSVCFWLLIELEQFA